MPKFSIIIPTLNSSKTISKSITSILNQTFPDFEILIIDACSTDDTIFIIKSFDDSRIKITQEIDNGIYDAMNKGLRNSNGNWIYFLGSDDFLYGNYILKEINEIISEKDTDVIYGDVISSRFNGRYFGKFEFYNLLKNNICHQSVFINRNVFEKKGFFNLKYKSHADWDHNLKWFLDVTISKTYVDLIIANYNDGGYSSLNFDKIFSNDKEMNFLKYNRGIINFSFGIGLVKRVISKFLKNKDFKKLLELLFLLPGILLKFKFKGYCFYQ